MRRRAAAWAGLLLAVLLLHGLLFVAVVPDGSHTPGVAAPQRPAAIRLLALAPRAMPDTPAEATALPQVKPPIDDAAADQPNKGRRVAVLAPMAQAEPAPKPMPAAPLAGSAAERAALPTVAQQPPASDEATVPVYATRLPASASLHYQLQRGSAVGNGRLVWQRQAEGYEIGLEGELQGMPVLSIVSRGLIDADGVAPLRLAERRRSREHRAANFQRAAQRITFSGPQIEYALQAGAQDRLSWMIQLPAIIEANPALAQPGARIALFVVGTRGDAQTWWFEVQDSVPLSLPAGAVAQALHLLREPRRPCDTRVEVWLDTQRQHLPVRAVLTSVPYAQPLELNLSLFVQPGQ
jgi:Protein of unknown function (DUF3108)